MGVHHEEFQTAKTFLGQLNGLGVRVEAHSVGRLNGGQEVSKFAADVEDPAVRANDELINSLEPAVIITVASSPA